MTGNSGSQKSGSSQKKEGPRKPRKQSVVKESTGRKQEQDQLGYQASVLETINDAIVVTDLSFRITFWNKASERVYGWKAEEVLGHQANDILRSNMTPEQRSARYSDLQNGNPVVTELVQLTRDDRELVIRGYTIPLRDAQGKITGFVAVNQDVTEQKKKEAEREQLLAQLDEQRKRAESLASEAQQRADELDATFTALAEAVIVYDASGKAQRANPAAVKLLGFDVLHVDIAGMVGKLSSRYPDGRPIEPANTPSARALAGETVSGERFILTNAEGRAMTVIASSTPLWNNGQVSGAVTVWHDVTEREQLLNDVQRRAAELDTIITSIADGVMIQDIHGNLLHMNPAAQEMIDYSLEEQALTLADRATRVLKITSGDGQQLTNAEDMPVSHALRGEMVHNIQLEILHTRTGQKTWVLTSAAPLRTPEGAVFGAVATLTDITPLRNAERALEEANAYLERRVDERTVELEDTNEQLKQALKREQQMQAQLIQSEKFAAISRLVASVAHELNNPIQTIQNCMFLLEQVIPLDDPSRDFLDMSISEAKRIAKLVDQLRETYRPAKTYAAEVFDVLELLTNTQNILEPHLKQNHIQMKIKPSKEHFLVNGVADQIKQVFLNIILNAIESMQPAGGSLNVSIAPLKETKMVSIAFKDNGPGISEEDLSRIFEPFFTTKLKGTGLGVFSIIKRYHLG